MKKSLISIIALLAVIALSVTGCPNNPSTPTEDPELTGTVTISGIAAVGQTLTANTDNLDGSESDTISYQWKRSDAAATPGTAIGGANGKTYELVKADEGKYITVTVTRAGFTGSVTSDPTDAVAAEGNLPALTGTVTITGTPTVGETLTANTSLGGSGAISYQWKRSDAAATPGTDIEDETSKDYILTGDDEGKYITVSVTRANNSGSVTSQTAIGPIVADDSGDPSFTQYLDWHLEKGWNNTIADDILNVEADTDGSNGVLKVTWGASTLEYGQTLLYAVLPTGIDYSDFDGITFKVKPVTGIGSNEISFRLGVPSANGTFEAPGEWFWNDSTNPVWKTITRAFTQYTWATWWGDDYIGTLLELLTTNADTAAFYLMPLLTPGWDDQTEVNLNVPFVDQPIVYLLDDIGFYKGDPSNVTVIWDFED